jgi:hypothetical protein
MPTTDTPSIIAARDGADRGRQAVGFDEGPGSHDTLAAGLSSAAREIMLGSAAIAVLHHTDRPVVVVPSGRGRPAD